MRRNARHWQLPCLAGFFFALAQPIFGQVEIEEVSVRRLDAAHFKRLTEYFTGHESTGNRVLLRSDPATRGGLYFTLELSDEADNLPAGSQFRVQYIRPDLPDALEQLYPLPATNTAHHTVYLGLTGDTWPDSEALPLAFRVSLVGPDGQELDHYQSFLWEME